MGKIQQFIDWLSVQFQKFQMPKTERDELLTNLNGLLVWIGSQPNQAQYATFLAEIKKLQASLGVKQ